MTATPGPRPRRRGDKALLSRDAVVAAALAVLREDGLDAVTMRRVAAELRTGPASLYVYVPDRQDLLEAMLDAVLTEVAPEPPDPARWREQVHALMGDVVAALLRHPGIAGVGLGSVPVDGAGLRLREAMLELLLAGGVERQAASWGIDVLPLLAFATALESGSYRDRGTDLAAERRRITEAYNQLSPDAFPAMVAHLDAVLAGSRAERFRFAVDAFLDGLPRRR